MAFKLIVWFGDVRCDSRSLTSGVGQCDDGNDRDRQKFHFESCQGVL